MDTFIQSKVKKYTKSDPRQLKLKDRLITMIAETMSPLSLVEHTSFIEYCDEMDPRYTLPSRKQLSNKILMEKKDTIHACMSGILANVSNVCVTVDIWSNRQMRSYLGVTGHYIEEYTVRSVMLACKRFKGRHTADNIAAQYAEITTFFGIQDKVTHINTDNASNMVKAFRLPGFEATVQVDDADSDEEADTDSDDYDSDDSEDSGDGADLFDLLPESQHDPCFAHTLQLVVKDGMKEATYLRKVISKASTIVAHVRKSTHATDILEGEIRVQAANATRWNSEVKMIRSVLRIPVDKLDSLDTTKLTPHERSTLGDMMSVLTPFEEATDHAQIQNTAAAGHVIPSIRGLRSTLSGMSKKYNGKLVVGLSKSLEKRLVTYERNPVFQMAAALDPRFKFKWCKDATEEANVQSLIVRQLSISPNATVDQSDTTEAPPMKRSRLYSFMNERYPSDTTAPQPDTTHDELKRYDNSPCIPEQNDPLRYWGVHADILPLLTQLALRHLVVPASSAAVERLFSVGGKFFRPERCRLSDKTFEALMCIKNNGYLLKQ